MNEILNKTLKLSKNTRFLAALGLACSFLCIFFTYVKYTVLGMAVKIKLIDFFEGKLLILLILLNLMFVFKDYVKKYLPKLFQNNLGKKIENINDQRLTLIPTILMVIFAFVVKGETKVEFLNIKYGLGFFLMWLGVISLVIYAFIYKNNNIKVLEKMINNTTPSNKANVNSVNSSNTQSISQNNNITTNINITEPNPNQVTNETIKEQKTCINCGSKSPSSALKCIACGKEF